MRLTSDCHWLILCCLLFVIGCGKSTLVTIPVSGRITLNQGDWPVAGVLYFAPIQAAPGHKIKPGTAKFDPSGYFTAKTKVDGDGLVPGKYYVNIECWLVAPTADPDGPRGQTCVPPRYESGATSGLIVEVPAEASRIEVNFDVPAKRSTK